MLQIVTSFTVSVVPGDWEYLNLRGPQGQVFLGPKVETEPTSERHASLKNQSIDKVQKKKIVN